MMDVICEYCGKAYPESTNNKRFCSRKCWIESQKMPVLRICERCGNEFTVAPYQLKNGGGKYCSRACKHKRTKPEPNCTCAICGTIFHEAPANIKNGGGKYCSRECHAKGLRKRVECTCLYCGKIVYKKPCEIKGRKKIYCSHECWVNGIKAEQSTAKCKVCGKDFTYRTSTKRQYCSRPCARVGKTGVSSKLWKGGAYYNYGLNWDTQRKLAYDRDGGICQHCGLTEGQAKKQYGRRNSVHHIVKRRWFRDNGINIEESSKLPNLITLCSSCHILAEHGHITLQPKLL